MSANENIKNKIFSGLIWKFLERMGVQGVGFIVSLILARLLGPKDYGTISLITVFTAILQVFIDSGLGLSLIQKKDADDLDFSTVFYFNIFSSIILYLLIFFLAPLISKFYKLPELTPLIRVLTILILISGVKNIQHAYVSKHMIFKKFFFSTLIGTIIAAFIGIFMAYKGFGPWALIAQQLSSSAINTIVLWTIVKWRPKKAFSFERFKGLFNFGYKILISQLINTIYDKLRQLIIGKMYTTSDLAYYNKGSHLPSLIVTNINSSINSVLLPGMSKEQDNVEKLKNMTRKSIKTSSFLMMPLMIGLAICAEPIIRLILTEKWLPCVPYLRVFCFTYAFYPIHTANLTAIQALGRSDIFLKLEVIKKIIGLAVILITMWFGVKIMAYSLIFTSIISQIINSWPNKKLLNYSYLEQLKDIIPEILLSILMGGIVFCVYFLKLNDLITLLIQIPLGCLIYILLAKIFKNETYIYLKSSLKEFIKRKKTQA